MNPDNAAWIVARKDLLGDEVLEVGSMIVAGQEHIALRDSIQPLVKKFIGLDMRPGNGVDVVANAGYRARLQFVGEEKLVKSYFLEGDDPWVETIQAVNRCVRNAVRMSTEVKFYYGSDIEARAVSISSMNSYCPLDHYGYEWVGTLDIIQCNSYPDDQGKREQCIQAARFMPGSGQ